MWPSSGRATLPAIDPAVRAAPVSLPAPAPPDLPTTYVRVNLHDDAGLPVWLKLVIVLGILAVVVLRTVLR